MILEPLRPCPWGFEVVRGEMPVVLRQPGTRAVSTEDTGDHGRAGSLPLTRVVACAPLYKLSGMYVQTSTLKCSYMDFHACAATCTFEEAQETPVGTDTLATGNHEDWSLAPKGAEIPD